MKPDVFSFGLGGIIVPSEAVQELSEKVKALCRRWNVPALHGNKIRAGKGKFGFVKKDAARRQTFLAELEAVIIDKRITAHACVICRPGYRDRYFERHAEPSRWQMSRTAFDIAVERAAKFAMTRDRRLSVVYERSGEREDRLLEAYFRGLLARGTEFDPGNASRHRPLSQQELSATLQSIWPDGKGNPLLQLADLVLHPLCQRPSGSTNHAYDRLVEAGQIIDAQGCEDPAIAVKYSCYDGPYNAWGNNRNA